MIAAWMLYFIAISLLLGIAALVAERALPARRARRWLWSAALILSVVLAPVVHIASNWDASQRALMKLAEAAPPSAGAFISESPIEWVAATPIERSSVDADRWLVVAWVAASALLLALYGVSSMLLRR